MGQGAPLKKCRVSRANSHKRSTQALPLLLSAPAHPCPDPRAQINFRPHQWLRDRDTGHWTRRSPDTPGACNIALLLPTFTEAGPILGFDGRVASGDFHRFAGAVVGAAAASADHGSSNLRKAHHAKRTNMPTPTCDMRDIAVVAHSCPHIDKRMHTDARAHPHTHTQMHTHTHIQMHTHQGNTRSNMKPRCSARHGRCHIRPPGIEPGTI